VGGKSRKKGEGDGSRLQGKKKRLQKGNLTLLQNKKKQEWGVGKKDEKGGETS